MRGAAFGAEFSAARRKRCVCLLEESPTEPCKTASSTSSASPVSARRGRNRYLRTRFLPAFNAEFARQPADPTSAFVPVGRVDLIRSFASRTSASSERDNVVTTGLVPLQFGQAARPSHLRWASRAVRHHLNGQHSVWYGAWCLGRFTPHGQPLRAA
jgi:hypothetical protein